MNKYLLYYDCLDVFRKQYFKDLLTADHLITQEVYIQKAVFPDGGADDNYNFWGYTFEKEGVKYLLPSKIKNRNTGLEEDVVLSNILPFFPLDTQKISFKGQVYLVINRPVSARFESVKKMSVKKLVDSLSTIEHSNSVHRRLLTMIGLTSLIDRAYFRVATPPAFGKDSVVDTFSHLVGGCSTIVQPTLAKLEFRTTYKWLVVNEVVDIGKSEWDLIQQFLLDAAAYKLQIEKHSRAIDTRKEILDISNFSLSLFYNDINNYPDTKKYIDSVTKDAVLDRFPPLRLYGHFTENFNSIRDVDVNKIVTENMDFYKDLIYTFTYLKSNLDKEVHGYKINGLKKMKQRWKTSTHKLLKVVDAYCDNQEEFDKWIKIINSAMEDYEDMLAFPEVRSRNPKTPLDDCDTFTDMIKKMSGAKVLEDVSFW